MPQHERDRYRQAVYRAEDQWSAVLDRGGEVDFFGSRLTAPLQLRFGNLDDVETYVGRVCSNRDIGPPGVRRRKGGSRAHYEVESRMIAIPVDHTWAMRESVILHEVAHHICVIEHSSNLHDAHFTSIMLSLVRAELGHEAELLLRTGYVSVGASV